MRWVKSRIASSITSVTSGVAPEVDLPVEVLMKSAPASIASIDAWRTWSSEPSSDVSRITLRCASPQASFTRTISSCTRASSPDRNASREMTMSISSAPAATVSSVSAILTASDVCPDGNPVDTDAVFTPVPRSAATAVGTSAGIDADRRDRRHLGRVRIGADALRAQVADLAGRVLALERGEVDHRDREADPLGLRGRLDRALAQQGGALLDPDPVDVRQTAEHEAPVCRMWRRPELQCATRRD